MSLFRLTRNGTYHIYRQLWRANSAEATIGEETLTDLLTIELKLGIKFSNLEGIDTQIIQCNKSKEKELGADFLWYIRSNKSKKYIGLYLQAKKSSNNEGSCMLWHDYTNEIPLGGGGKITRQVDNLIHNAKIHKAIPLYCIYNFLEYSNLDKNNTDYLRKRGYPSKFIVPLEFSFTYVDARHVRSLLNQKNKDKDGNEITNRRTFKFKEIMGFPLYTLFTKLHDMDNSETITQRVYRNANLIYESLKDHNHMSGKRNSFDINNLSEEHNYILHDLPDHIRDLINNRPIRNKNIDENLLPSAIIITSTDEDVTDKKINELLEQEKPFML